MTSSYAAITVNPQSVKSGTLTTLAALGSYDKFIVCDAQKASFPVQTFSRHTNFAIGFQLAAIANAPLGSGFWERGRELTFSFDKTERSADLIGPTFLHCQWGRLAATVDPSTNQIAYVNELGNAVVSSARFSVGGVPIEEVTGEALHCMNELGVRGPGLDESMMLGKAQITQTTAAVPQSIPITMRVWSTANRHTYTPLNFHFCHRREEYFPLVAVQYQAPEILLRLRGKVDLIRAVNTVPDPNEIVPDATIVSRFASGEYVGGELLAMDIGYSGVYLDSEERRARANKPYSYVFQYVHCKENFRVQKNQRVLEQKVSFENATSSYWWFYRRDSIDRVTATGGPIKDYFDFSTRQPYGSIPLTVGGVDDIYVPLNPFAGTRILVNNNVRVAADGLFFNQVNPYIALANRLPREPSFINSFNFGMDAAQWNYDNGSQNDSKIDNLVFEFTFENSDAVGGVATNNGLDEAGTVFVYANKFSVAKISGGQYGLLYSTI